MFLKVSQEKVKKRARKGFRNDCWLWRAIELVKRDPVKYIRGRGASAIMVPIKVCRLEKHKRKMQ